MKILHRIARPSLSCLVAAVAHGQGAVLVVDDDLGPGVDYASIQGAVDAAADLDVILVREGSYDRFEIVDKALTVIGEGGPVIGTGLFESGNATIRVTDLSVDKTVTLRGLVVESFLVIEFTPGVQLADNDGPVLLEDLIVSTPMGSGVSAFRCASVTLQRCSLEGGTEIDVEGGSYTSYPGVSATETDLYVYDSAALGSPGGDAQAGNPLTQFPDIVPGVGGAGLRLRGGSLLATGSTLAGGAGGGDAPDLCFAGMDGGPGLLVEAFETEPVVRLLDTVTSGGPGGFVGEPACAAPNGQSGAARVIERGTLEEFAGAARSFVWDATVAGGATFDVAYHGEPGDFAFLLLAFDLGPGTYLDGTGAALLVEPSFLLAPLGFVPASGILAQELPAPVLQVFPSLVVTAQAAFFDAASGAFLSGPSSLTVLGPPF